MKAFYIALAMMASTAHAETFVLHQHKAWEVSWNEDNGVTYCSASVAGNGLYFSVDAVKGYGLHVYVIDDSKSWTPASGLRMYAYVDGRRGWEIDGVEVEDTVTTFQLFGDAGRRFVNDLIHGQWLYVDYNAQDTQPGAWDVSFSLAGSAAAIAALNDCIGKL